MGGDVGGGDKIGQQHPGAGVVVGAEAHIRLVRVSGYDVHTAVELAAGLLAGLPTGLFQLAEQPFAEFRLLSRRPADGIHRQQIFFQSLDCIHTISLSGTPPPRQSAPPRLPA